MIYDRDKMLALSKEAFDQDLDAGWRALARHDECITIAADIIRDYREKWRLNDKELWWHEGQLRAVSGETERAVSLLERSRSSANERMEWSLYVDATVAFLRKDSAKLNQARERLANLPQPPDWPPRDSNDRPINISWPPNLDVVDRLIQCFGREYKEAYGNCR
jgi:hypothetical protein